MHLKTLTLKGFKSFASATTLRLEPGITCVVGPNGSGKSNVVDALAWVMGEQGAKSLRGGKMEDVIFAGTAGRPPLGRAEVSLTIDNTDGALPIDYTEVTITRTMFRSGGSEYAINGAPARLLDVQELLSDSGIGREMHVVVGQNQLDAVLRATPEERRGFIEEAAGVLKHRKRKEKALRKLDAMQANLTRLTDLTAEIRRQLGPLGRQAEVARRARTVQADVRDARARLLADELVQLTATLEAEVADETALRRRQQEVESRLEEARARLGTLERLAQEASPRLAAAADTYYALQSLRERLRGTATLAAERLRLLGSAATEERGGGRDPGDLEAQAAEVRAQEAALAQEVARLGATLQDAVTARTDAEQALTEEDRRVAARLRAAADRREGLARLAGQVAARRSRVEAAEGEIGRLRDALAEAERRGAAAQSDFTAVESQVAGVEEGEEDLDAEHEAAVAALADVEAELDRLREAERDAERDRATWTARREALEMGLERKDGAGALLAAGEQLPGLLGPLAGLLAVEAGYEDAVAAALGDVADAVAVDGLGSAVDALRLLRDQDAGRAGLLVGPTGAGEPVEAPSLDGLPEGTVALVDVVAGRAPVADVVRSLLARHVLVPGLAEARRVVSARPDLVAVTAAGDVLSVTTARGGSAAAPSRLQVQAAVDEATERLQDAVRRAERSRFGVQEATARRDAARERVEAALERLHESDARLAAVAERLGQLGSVVRAARAEAERLTSSLARATEQLEADRRDLHDLTERLRAAQEEPAEAEPDTGERDRLAAAAAAARTAETEARLALRTGEERLRALSGRAESLERAARTEREAAERAARRAEQRRRQAEVARAVEVGAAAALRVLERTLAAAADDRDAAEAERARRAAETAQVREQLDTLAAELRELTDSVHADEVARAQQRLRVEQLQQRATEELGLDPEVLVEEFGPHRPVPPSPPAPGDPEPDEPPAAVPFVRAEQEKRLRRAERALAQLGRVNPLALEEFAALEERHKFLTEQLEDLKRSRKDLLDIVRQVDERVEQVFAEAFDDTARHFEEVFPRLFPGGEGRLVLTDPDDLLTTGIEVEARPAGKKVKRLSLLSGGERSLTAVALLVAIFKARPSPFYVLDEVEAALDDTNLGRLITLLEELRASSQLIIITHQKRTMEIADALYGVSMRGDGVTTVVSQRLRELADA
ncbi:chromosome segregation protein SMC [Kineosporiaceae bacterium SCSIO 59966]|nr:chromosome segregation protein SMC [Kineosporiaceae bacterium SCSIO 59966]